MIVSIPLEEPTILEGDLIYDNCRKKALGLYNLEKYEDLFTINSYLRIKEELYAPFA